MLDIRKLLGFPLMYRLFGKVVGGLGARQTIAKEYLRAKPGYRILDIGCGPGDILAVLPEDVHYVGVDLSPSYIEAARKRFGTRGEFHNISVNDFVVQQGGTCDLAMANGVLHHLNDEECIKLFEIARAALRPGGRLVTVDGCFTSEQSRLARFVVGRDRGEFVRPVAEYLKLARRVFPSMVSHVRHNLLHIPYTHLIMECMLESQQQHAAA